MKPTQNPSATLIRIPVPGQRCTHTGLSRSSIYALITPSAANGYRPPVASHVVKTSRQAKRGIRLVELESLLAYIRFGKGAFLQKPKGNPSGKA
jgi:hypothetical protein